MNARDIVLLLGVCFAGIGLLSTITPALSIGGVEFQGMTAVAVGIVLLGVYMIKQWVFKRSNETVPPTYERLHPSTVPGDHYDDLFVNATSTMNPIGQSVRSTLRNRISSIAVDVMVAYDDVSEDEARKAIHQGTWSPDPEATGFFQYSGVRDRIRDVLPAGFAGEAPFHRRARYAVDALYRKVFSDGDP